VQESKLKTAIQVIIFAVLGAAILYFMWQGQGAAYAEECALQEIPSEDCSLFDKLVSDYKTANLFWLIIISVCFVASQILRAVRWKLLLQPMGYQVSSFNAIATLMVGYFANLGVPRIGEFVRAGLISKYEEVPVEKAFATIVVERIIDVIMLAIMIGLGLLLHYDVLWGYIEENTSISSSNLLIGFIGLVLLGLFGLYILYKIRSMDVSGLPKIAQKIKGMIDGFVDGLLEIRKLPRAGLFVAQSIGIWVLYYLMHYLCFFAFKPTSHLSPSEGLLVFDFGALGVVFPSPGGMGSYHFMIMEALEVFGVNSVDGFSFAMISFFTLTIFCTIAIGLICLILLPIVNGRRQMSKV